MRRSEDRVRRLFSALGSSFRVLPGFARWLFQPEALPEESPDGKKSLGRGIREGLGWILAPESLPEAPAAVGGAGRPSIFRTFLSPEALPEAAPAPMSRQGRVSLFKFLLASEELPPPPPREEKPRRISFFRWLFSAERIEDRASGKGSEQGSKDERR